MEGKSRIQARRLVLECLNRLEIGDPLTLGGLTVFPVQVFRDPGYMELQYVTLGEALQKGWSEVSERPAASVPELVLYNKSNELILVLDGEEIIGGRQNRIANASYLIAARAKVTVPVSCVESGRWRDATTLFAAGERLPQASIRAKDREIALAMSNQSRAAPDQGFIWSEVGRYHCLHDVESPTRALKDVYTGKKKGSRAVRGGAPLSNRELWCGCCRERPDNGGRDLRPTANCASAVVKTDSELCIRRSPGPPWSRDL